VSTKHGMIKTDHILFIASGAFHMSKPSDLIPELQGRLPIRVELAPLTVEDFVRILTEPDASLTEQYSALLGTEERDPRVHRRRYSRASPRRLEINERSENIGARRLHTVMERLLEAVSFTAPAMAGQTVSIDAAYVDTHIGRLIGDNDLAKYIL
jgi:ATP-dependent HslUV protease ATP-binding subunit HslU